MNKYIIELIGTLFLTLVAATTGNPIAIGVVLCALVYAGGPISGGHYNPAVTVGLLIRGKIKVIEGLFYIISQALGGFIAAILVYFLNGKQYFVPTPPAGSTLSMIYTSELVFTFLLVFVILHVATSEKTKGNQYFGLAIGFALMAAVYAASRYSGGVLNPAIGFGLIFYNVKEISSNMTNLLVYLTAPTLGGVLAGTVYRTLYHSEIRNEKKQVRTAPAPKKVMVIQRSLLRFTNEVS